MPEGQDVGNTAVDTAPALPAGDSTTATTTESQNGQASAQAQSAPAEESFSSIDPNTLSPELQKVHKSLQADYTRKMQNAADLRKKAESYDQISRDPRFVETWNQLSQKQKAEFQDQKAEAEKTLGQSISDQDFAKAFESKDSFLSLIERAGERMNAKSQRKIEQLEQKLSVAEAADVVETFASEAGPDGKPLRPDFYNYDEDGLISGFLKINASKDMSPETYHQALDSAYSWSKSMTSKYYEKGRQDALSRIQQKAAGSSEMPTNAAKNAYTGGDPKKLTDSEAVALARKGIRVPQDY